MSLAARLEAELARLAAEGGTVGYGELARRLEIGGPGQIARLTALLEATMAEDAAAGRPFRAALCEGKLRGGLPARGFFETAARLGRYSGGLAGPEAEAFAKAERAALYRTAQAARD